MSFINHKLDLINIKHSEYILEQNIHLFDIYDWRYISQYQELSESFIEKYQDKITWYIIFQYQSLSISFIKKYKNIIFWNSVFFNKNIPINTKLLFSTYFKWIYICHL